MNTNHPDKEPNMNKEKQGVTEKVEAGLYTYDAPYPQGVGRNAETKRDAWHTTQDALMALLKTDLEVEHGLTGHPKAQLLFNLAYGKGIDFGHTEVAYQYATLAELLK